MSGDAAGGGPLVRVEVLLEQGHRESLTLAADSPVLRELLAALAGGGGPVVELPLEGGARTLTVPTASLVGVTTEPPVGMRDGTKPSGEPASPPPRSVQRLREHPPILITDSTVPCRHENFPRYRERAKVLIEAFERSRPRRLERLRAAVDRLGARTIAVSSFNAGYVPMFANWAASCDRHEIPCREFAVLFPTDAQADRAARDLGFETCFDKDLAGAVPERAHRTYGDGDFALSMFPKVAAIQDAIDVGVDLVRQDMDLVWFEDPRPHLEALARAEDADMLFMRDRNARFQPLYYNSGFVFTRSNELTRCTWQRLFEALPEILWIRSEQEVLHQIVLCHRERGLRTARLPDAYVDGELLNLADLSGRKLPERPIVAHVNWTANLEEKIQRLRNLGFWYLDDAAADG